ncbi:ABC transporter substrate-binding protein [Ureibacillus sp. NPDC094379]
MKKIISLLLLTVLIIAGCSSNSSTPSTSEGSKEASTTPVKGGELNVAINTQPATLDPHTSTATILTEVSRHIYEQLVSLDTKFQVQPMLAESIDESEDGTSYTFHLRQGVKFHNGKEMKAEDVVASLNKWRDISSKAKNMIPEATFTAIDEYTVEMKIPERIYGVLTLLADNGQFAAIMPKEIAESASPTGATEYIGTGPFKFVEWKQDQYIHLAKNEDYTPLDTPTDGLTGKKEALVDDIYLHIVSDASTRVAGIQSGQYDIALTLPPENYDMLNNNPNLKTEMALKGHTGFVYNKTDRVFANEKMRQAFNAALDMDSIMLAAFSKEEFYRINPSYMLQEQVDWASEVGSDRYNVKDLDLAKQLLQEAGYNGEEIKILATREYEYMYNSAVVIKEIMEEIGVNVTVEVVDWATLLDLRTDPTGYDAFITGFPIVMTPPQLLYLSSTWPGWTNDEQITQLIAKLNASTTAEEAKASWDQIQDRMYDYLPISKFGDYYEYYGVSNKVEGMTILDGMILWNTSKAK